MNLKDILHEIVNVAAGHGARQDLHDAIDAAEIVERDASAAGQVVADAAEGGF